MHYKKEIGSFLVKLNISQTITLAHCQSCNFIAIRDVFHLVSLTKSDLDITCWTKAAFKICDK